MSKPKEGISGKEPTLADVKTILSARGQQIKELQGKAFSRKRKASTPEPLSPTHSDIYASDDDAKIDALGRAYPSGGKTVFGVKELDIPDEEEEVGPEVSEFIAKRANKCMRV